MKTKTKKMKKMKVSIGVPKSLMKNLGITKGDIEETLIPTLEDLGLTLNDVDVDIQYTNGEFYTKIDEEEKEFVENETPIEATDTELAFDTSLREALKTPEEDESLESAIVEEHIKKGFDDDDASVEDDYSCYEKILEDELNDVPYPSEEYDVEKPISPLGCAKDDGLTTFEKNVALLKLYYALKCTCGCQVLRTSFGEVYLDDKEREFLLHKLFVGTHFDNIVHTVEFSLNYNSTENDIPF